MTKEGYIEFAQYVLKRLGLKIPKKFPLRLDQVYDEFVRDHHVNRPGMVHINWTVARFYDIDPGELHRETKGHEVTHPRHIAIYLMWCNGHTVGLISKYYNQGHSNISLTVKKIDKMYNHPWKAREMTQNIRTLKYQLL